MLTLVKTLALDDTESPNPDYESWLHSDGLLKSWIIGTLLEEALGHVFDLETSTEVWEALANQFA